MLKGILSYHLQGIEGWGDRLEIIDVANVKSMVKRSRLFMIFNREYPYTMRIEYENLHTDLVFSPVVGGNNNNGYVTHTRIKPTVNITRRYKTEDDMNSDYNNIIEKQKDLKKYVEKIKNDIEKMKNDDNIEQNK
jgi:hypothetical protein